jgi:hypothetical protein
VSSENLDFNLKTQMTCRLKTLSKNDMSSKVSICPNSGERHVVH